MAKLTAEEKQRQLKQGYNQRTRTRKRIAAGRATPQEIEAIAGWERGDGWNLPLLKPRRAQLKKAAPKRTPRPTIEIPPAQEAMEGETEERAEPKIGSWLVAGFFALLFLWAMFSALRSPLER